jgi:hypothetical protein
MAAWQEHMASNVTWAEIGMTEYQLLESILKHLEDGRVRPKHVDE